LSADLIDEHHAPAPDCRESFAPACFALEVAQRLAVHFLQASSDLGHRGLVRHAQVGLAAALVGNAVDAVLRLTVDERPFDPIDWRARLDEELIAIRHYDNDVPHGSAAPIRRTSVESSAAHVPGMVPTNSVYGASGDSKIRSRTVTNSARGMQ